MLNLVEVHSLDPSTTAVSSRERERLELKVAVSKLLDFSVRQLHRPKTLAAITLSAANATKVPEPNSGGARNVYRSENSTSSVVL